MWQPDNRGGFQHCIHQWLERRHAGQHRGHGNIIIGGSGTVIIGDTVVNAPFSGLLPMPVNFTDRLKLVNDVTGEPMPNHAYVIQRADGRLEHGVSDAAGFTHEISSHVAESIKLFLEE